MPLRILKEGVTLHAMYEDAVGAYDRESGSRRARLGPKFVFGVHPTDIFSLGTYKGVQVNSAGMLMTSATGLRYRMQKVWYRNRNAIGREDLPNLERRGIYYNPMWIRSADGVLVWQRSDSDF